MKQKIKINSAFGKNLRRLRKEHGFTQEEIVAKLQLKDQTFQEVLTLKSNVEPITFVFLNSLP